MSVMAPLLSRESDKRPSPSKERLLIMRNADMCDPNSDSPPGTLTLRKMFQSAVSAFVVLCVGLTSCTGTPRWTEAQEKNFLRSCLQHAEWASRDKCVPLSREVRELVLAGAPQKCLLTAASKIIVAPDQEAENAARAALALCLKS